MSKISNRFLNIICGYSGSGKNTIMKALTQLFEVERIITCTTRPMREGEVDGVDYIFLPQKKFTRYKKEKKFFETVDYNASFGQVSYGTLYKDLRGIKYIIANPAGIKAFKDIPHLTFFLDVPEKTLINRLEERGDAPEEINRRLTKDKEDFKDIINDPSVIKIKYNDTDAPSAIAGKIFDTVNDFIDTNYPLIRGLSDITEFKPEDAILLKKKYRDNYINTNIIGYLKNIYHDIKHAASLGEDKIFYPIESNEYFMIPPILKILREEGWKTEDEPTTKKQGYITVYI